MDCFYLNALKRAYPYLTALICCISLSCSAMKNSVGVVIWNGFPVSGHEELKKPMNFDTLMCEILHKGTVQQLQVLLETRDKAKKVLTCKKHGLYYPIGVAYRRGIVFLATLAENGYHFDTVYEVYPKPLFTAKSLEETRLLVKYVVNPEIYLSLEENIPHIIKSPDAFSWVKLLLMTIYVDLSSIRQTIITIRKILPKNLLVKLKNFYNNCVIQRLHMHNMQNFCDVEVRCIELVDKE